MFTTDVSELTDKKQIMNSVKVSNKLDSLLQSLDIHARRKEFEILLLNLEATYSSSE